MDTERTAATDCDKERSSRDETFLEGQGSRAEDAVADSSTSETEPSTVELDRKPSLVSSGVICLCEVSENHQRSAEPMQLSRALGLDPSLDVTPNLILLVARQLGLKAKVVRSSWSRLSKATRPAILNYSDVK